MNTGQHPLYMGEEGDSCDLCNQERAAFRIFSPEQLGYRDMKEAHDQGLYSTGLDYFILCSDCEKVTEDANVELPGNVNIPSESPLITPHVPKLVQPSAPPFKSSTPPAPLKCNEPHFTKIEGPAGYGHLRLSSERGGKYIDTTCDYGLFFSGGWDSIGKPDVETWTPGHKPAVPILKGADIDDWPACAFVDWPDMGPPTSTVLAYAKWAHEQWSQGKSIQFGCFGAHGRTGTFLALLFLLSGQAKDGKMAMDMVHQKHCKDAIESKRQEDAIVAYADALYPPF